MVLLVDLAADRQEECFSSNTKTYLRLPYTEWKTITQQRHLTIIKNRSNYNTESGISVSSKA
jgi:hypothetical protein